MIAAMDEHRAIGRNGLIPWRVPGEQKMFRELTMGKIVVMGRSTYESIPNGLPGRRIVVLTRSSEYRAERALCTAHSLDEALQVTAGETEIAIAGGAQIYSLFMDIARTIHLTTIHAKFGGDAYFPEIAADKFEVIESRLVQSGEFSYTYQRLQRIGAQS